MLWLPGVCSRRGIWVKANPGIVPFEMVDAVLAETGRTQERVRVLRSRVVVYLLLAGALFESLGYLAVWRAADERNRAGAGGPAGGSVPVG